jgi:superfamily II DNA or RNA helicase
MTATPEALETERASIQRFADKLEMDRTIGLLDAGGVQIERELLDWRIDTFNQALDQRSDLKMETIDASSVYTDAAAKAQDRRQAAEESYREQSPGLQSPEEKAAWLEEAREMRERVDREIQRVAQQAPTSAELLAAIDKHLPKQSPEEEAERFEESRATMERIDREIRRDSLVVDLFANQENNIREEWLADLQTGRLDRHALDSYFAGRVDQHNTLIGMAVEAHPHLRETLPPPIQYGQIRDDLQRQIAQAQQVGERNSHAVEEQFRFAV